MKAFKGSVRQSEAPHYWDKANFGYFLAGGQRPRQGIVLLGIQQLTFRLGSY